MEKSAGQEQLNERCEIVVAAIGGATHAKGRGVKAILGFMDALDRLQPMPARESHPRSRFWQNWKSAQVRSSWFHEAKPSSPPFAARHAHIDECIAGGT